MHSSKNALTDWWDTSGPALVQYRCTRPQRAHITQVSALSWTVLTLQASESLKESLMGLGVHPLRTPRVLFLELLCLIGFGIEGSKKSYAKAWATSKKEMYTTQRLL